MTTFLNYGYVWGYALLLVLIAGAYLWAYLDMKENPSKYDEGEWCYTQTIASGESVTQTSAGEHSYQFIATTEGIDVYVPCTE